MIIATNNNNNESNNSISESNMNYKDDSDHAMKSVEIQKGTTDNNSQESNNAHHHHDALVDPPSASTNTTSDDHSSTAGTSMSRASSPNSVESYTSDASSAPSSSSSSSSYTSSALSLHDDLPVPVASLLPSYLEGFVQHSHDDFFVSPYFEPQLLAQLMCEGKTVHYRSTVSPHSLVGKILSCMTHHSS